MKRALPFMKKPLRWAFSFYLSFILFLGLTAFAPAQQQSQWNGRLGHRVSVPVAKDMALKKTVQLQQLKRTYPALFASYSTLYVDVANWAGYVVGDGTGNGFEAVEATWNAPCKSGTVNSQIGYSSWVGLGGAFGGGVFDNPDGVEPLEQTGILLQSDGTYRLFWAYVSSDSVAQNIDQTDVIDCGWPITA